MCRYAGTSDLYDSIVTPSKYTKHRNVVNNFECYCKKHKPLLSMFVYIKYNSSFDVTYTKFSIKYHTTKVQNSNILEKLKSLSSGGALTWG